MTPPKFIVHLLSGGLDSTVLLYDLLAQGNRVHCVLFDYKQRHVQELQWARHHCALRKVLYTTLDVPELVGSTLTDGKGTVIVPNRNAIFLSLAVNVAVAAGAESITFAANKDDEATFPDCRRAFVDAMNAAVKAAGYSVEICGPYLDLTKREVAVLGAELGVNFDETWSCYEGGSKPCLICEACVKRQNALATTCVPFSL